MANTHNTPKVILTDLDQNKKFDQNEIITITTQTALKDTQKKIKDKASDRLCVKMKIKPEKERIYDKSYEL